MLLHSVRSAEIARWAIIQHRRLTKKIKLLLEVREERVRHKQMRMSDLTKEALHPAESACPPGPCAFSHYPEHRLTTSQP